MNQLKISVENVKGTIISQTNLLLNPCLQILRGEHEEPQTTFYINYIIQKCR